MGPLKEKMNDLSSETYVWEIFDVVHIVSNASNSGDPVLLPCWIIG